MFVINCESLRQSMKWLRGVKTVEISNRRPHALPLESQGHMHKCLYIRCIALNSCYRLWLWHVTSLNHPMWTMPFRHWKFTAQQKWKRRKHCPSPPAWEDVGKEWCLRKLVEAEEDRVAVSSEARLREKCDYLQNCGMTNFGCS